MPRVLLTDPGQIALQGAIDTLALWVNSWFLDLSAGMIWPQILGQKNVSSTFLETALEEAIESVPYVVSCDASVFFDPTTRALAYSFRAPLNTNQVLVGGSNQPFRVLPAPGGS